MELLGINRSTDNFPDANYEATRENSLPWLQDTAQRNVWGLWAVTYRDLIILDSSNRFVGKINLTTNDLGFAPGRTRLKDMLRLAANGGDYDGDKLPDHWELQMFNGLEAQPNNDDDADGFDNVLELAFASDPKSATSIPLVNIGFSRTRQFQVSFDRWAGTPSDFLVEMTTNLVDWAGSSLNIRTATTNYCDGTGRSRVTFTLIRSATQQPSGIVRVNTRRRP